METSTLPPNDTSNLRSYDVENMEIAIELSEDAYKDGHMPFGACLADSDGKIIVKAMNMSERAVKRGGTGDVTRHAEMELVRKLCDVVPMDDRPTCTLYTSTEPCVMCAGAIYWSNVGRIVYGATAHQLEKQLSGPGGFDVPLQKLYNMGSPGMHPIEIVGPIMEKEALVVHNESNCWPKCDGNLIKNKQVAIEELEEPTTTTASNEDIDTERNLFASGLGAEPARRDGITVPVIDISPNRNPDEIAEELFQAATTVGFFTVVNHGVSKKLILSAFTASEQFFDQSPEEKQAQSPFDKRLNSGYEYYSQLRPSTGTYDQKESIQITARNGCMEGSNGDDECINRWPTTPSNFQNVTKQLLEESNELAKRILRLLQPKACPHLNSTNDLIADSHTLWEDDGQCTLRLLHYPPMDKDKLIQLTTPDEQGRIHWRAGPHTDWDNITLLYQLPTSHGLECCANPKSSNREDIYWVPVDPTDNGIAINIGDMLARWSNHALYSNLHRVRMPTLEACDKSRYSIAFFAQSNKSTIIESPNGDTITAGDYILSRIKSNFTTTK